MTRSEIYWQPERILERIRQFKYVIRRRRYEKGDANKMINKYAFSTLHRACDTAPYLRDCRARIEWCDREIKHMKKRIAQHEQRITGTAA